MEEKGFLNSIRSFFSTRASIENPSTNIYQALTGMPLNGSGVSVTSDTALGITAVYNANLQISQDIATLPYKVVQKIDNKVENITSHPILETLNEPSGYVSGFVFDQALLAAYNLRGNGLAYIKEKKGRKELHLINVDKSSLLISERGAKFFNITLFNGREIKNVPDRDVIHIPNICFDGYWGIDPITNFKNTLGLTLGQEDYNNDFYKNGTSIQTVLEQAAPLKEGDGDKIRNEWQRLYGAGGKYGKNGLAVIGGGTKLHQVGISPEQSQFLQSRTFQIEEIARMFNIPLHKLKSLSGQPKANVEQMSKEYYSDTIQPIVSKYEIELTRKLLTEDEKANGFCIVKDMDEFLRASVADRFAAYQIGIVSQFMTPNDVRTKEGWSEIEGGDNVVNFQNPNNANTE